MRFDLGKVRVRLRRAIPGEPAASANTRSKTSEPGWDVRPAAGKDAGSASSGMLTWSG